MDERNTKDKEKNEEGKELRAMLEENEVKGSKWKYRRRCRREHTYVGRRAAINSNYLYISKQIS